MFPIIGEVIIRTNGGYLNINDTKEASHQTHYGCAAKVNVTTGTNCYVSHAIITEMVITAGKAIADESAYVGVVTAAPEVELEEANGGVFIIPSGTGVYNSSTNTGVATDVAATLGYKTENNTLVVDSSTTKGQERETKLENTYVAISNEAELAQFRDSVNLGLTYAGMTVKLTADITLTSAWTPIGISGYREAFSKNTSKNPTNLYFSGTFDGNHYTISGLTSVGYTPVYKASTGQYSYGLFGSVSGAIIKDLTMDNVYIYCNKGDSVGAIVGFSGGDLTLTGCTVNGTITALDAVGGIIGRCYKDIKGSDTEIIISNNTNNANVLTVPEDSINGRKLAGVLGFVAKYKNCLIDNNINNGNITMMNHNTKQSYYESGIALFGAGNGTGATYDSSTGQYINHNLTIKDNTNNGIITAQVGFANNYDKDANDYTNQPLSNGTGITQVAGCAGYTDYGKVVVTGNSAGTGSLSVSQWIFDDYPIVNLSQATAIFVSGQGWYEWVEANNNSNIEELLTGDNHCLKSPCVRSEVATINEETPLYTFSRELANAKDGDTITLTGDVTVNSSIAVYKNVTINLNGHTFTGNSWYALRLFGKCTLKNGTVSVNNQSWGVLVYDETTIENVSIINVGKNQYGKIALYASNENNKNYTVTIKNSSENYFDGSLYNSSDNNISFNVSGGKYYYQVPSKWLASGKNCTQDSDSKWVVE